MSEEKLMAWLSSQKYLPKELRDFHDQKDIFRMIEDAAKKLEPSSIERPNWLAAHCYVIDEFLWFMARHGYTLQRSHANLPFRVLSEAKAAWRQNMHLRFALALEGATKAKAGDHV